MKTIRPHLPSHAALLLLLAFSGVARPDAVQPGRVSADPARFPQTPYDVNAPVYPVAYTDKQKAAQIAAGRAVVKQINAAIKAGAPNFTVPPGVYRLPAQGPDNEINLYRAANFTLNLAHTEFFLARGTFIFPVQARNISIIGPVIMDGDPLVFTQGTIKSYDPTTGRLTIQLMPGYRTDLPATGTLDAFSPQGTYLANPSWARYSDGRMIDAAHRLFQMQAPAQNEIYRPGNLIASRLEGPVLVAARDVDGLTIRDVDDAVGAGIAWGGGTGKWEFINIRGIPRPGTNRLYGSGGCQVNNTGGSVLFDGCEFSDTTDDLIDYGGGGIFMVQSQKSPRELVLWRDNARPGDTLNFFAAGDFHPTGTARVVRVQEVDNPQLESDARRLIRDVVKARDVGDQTMHVVVLDRDVTATPGELAENGSGARPDPFVMRNCYLHDCAVRVMVQGFTDGLFENNTFNQISGGLALVCDAWWWEGATSRNITVRNNLFLHTTFRKGWGTGEASVTVGTGKAPQAPVHGGAFRNVAITGNKFEQSSRGAISVVNTAHVTILDNRIDQPGTAGEPDPAIKLAAVDDAQVADNTVSGSPDPVVWCNNVNGVEIKDNTFRDSRGFPAKYPPPVADASIDLEACTKATVRDNKVVNTAAPNMIQVDGSSDVQLSGNTASKTTAAGFNLVGLGTGDTEVHNLDAGVQASPP